MSELLAFLQTLINITRLSGRFASFYFECEHFRFVYILKQKQNNFVDFIKKNRFCRFDIYWIQINKQTNRELKNYR